MKKIYLIILAFITVSTVSAQTFLSKNFNDTSIVSGGWTNNIVTGTDNWYGATFSGQVFAKVTNYNGAGNDPAEVWMISPAFDLSTSNTPVLTFRSETNYVGAQLEVYVSTDYDGTSDPTTQGTWVMLNPTLPTSTTAWSGWVASGSIDLSASKGAATYLGYKYTGSSSDGKTWEVDDVLVVETATGPVFTVSTTDATCGNSDGSASVSVTSGTTPYTYMWSNGSTAAAATGLAQGTHSVTVTDAVGSTSGTASIGASNGPVVTVTSMPTMCNGSADGSATLTGGLTDYTYMWSNGGTSTTVSGLIAGSYGYTVTNGGGCTGMGSATVTQPAVIVVTGTSTNETMLGAMDGTATATASGGNGGFTYLWQNASTTTTISGLAQGSYMVTATDVNGCTGTATVTVDPDYLALSTIYSIQYTTAPSGDSPKDGVEVMVKGVVTGYCDYDHPSASRNYRGYFIQDADTAWSGLYVNDTVNYNAVSAGDTVLVVGTVRENASVYWDYTVLREVTSFTLVSTGGPEATAVALTTQETQNEKWEGVLVSVASATVVDDADAQYGEWTVNDGSGDLVWDNLMYWHSPNAELADKYSITGVMFSEFSSTGDEWSIEPAKPSHVTFMGVGIAENYAPLVSLYPNPTAGNVTIKTVGEVNVRIFNGTGQLIHSEMVNGSTNINLSNKAKGIYFVELQNETTTTTQKVIVK